MKHIALLLTAGIATAACSEVPKDAYFNRAAPESLLDMSSEVVTINLNDAASVNELIGWVNDDQPTRAELSCPALDPVCASARTALDQFSVKYDYTDQASAVAMLYYERVLARDCENRYIDNSINPYNLNHPTFGCSTAANMVQQVTDKRQFINPALLDFHDAEKSVQAVEKYNQNSDEGPGQGEASPIFNILGGG